MTEARRQRRAKKTDGEEISNQKEKANIIRLNSLRLSPVKPTRFSNGGVRGIRVGDV